MQVWIKFLITCIILTKVMQVPLQNRGTCTPRYSVVQVYALINQTCTIFLIVMQVRADYSKTCIAHKEENKRLPDAMSSILDIKLGSLLL